MGTIEVYQINGAAKVFSCQAITDSAVGIYKLDDFDEDRTIALIKHHEGLRLEPYKDTVGKLTWGYGRNLDDNELDIDEQRYLFQAIGRISKSPERFEKEMVQVATVLMAHELQRILYYLKRHMMPQWRACNAPRKAILVDMSYNMGWHGLGGFHATLAAIAADKWGEAARQMRQSKWASQVKTRADRLIKMMQTGEWPTDVPGLPFTK